ncbi:hypothetical protein [Pseudonocardia sp. T1-2H]|uniref:hypothetical protein n=1 Tax=Pseudonocardia sp. T1-2H TaxID=3128899 RepID=UPI003101A021
MLSKDAMADVVESCGRMISTGRRTRRAMTASWILDLYGRPDEQPAAVSVNVISTASD